MRLDHAVYKGNMQLGISQELPIETPYHQPTQPANDPVSAQYHESRGLNTSTSSSSWGNEQPIYITTILVHQCQAIQGIISGLCDTTF